MTFLRHIHIMKDKGENHAKCIGYEALSSYYNVNKCYFKIKQENRAVMGTDDKSENNYKITVV